MAIAVMGGLAASTLLSLVFVPAVFTLIDDLGRLIWRVFGRFVGERDEAAHHRPTDEPDAADAFGPDALPSPAE
jgi:HAE1 family hydrophobic/amphiphilic exporter-1